ncbi:Copper homeostasis protein CutF [Providencia rustigianii]|uniref:Copper homeostasis protein CutF n=2 Tax=Morganellaceae TaxID=1903414 RepID=A0A379G6U1_9GAMM|nr:Copper homeostasis protein CutF [Providencia rustigianii]SUC36602.1 Copper homeostasis protein CutF [Providencia rustigianii]VEB74458.1 Copper homeostasis protein CutF [Providencia rustigianii]VEH56407.1 Copper homeostasis protein CutF [Providencia rustigianii]
MMYFGFEQSYMNDLKGITMKKVFLLAFIAAGSIALSGCQSGVSEVESASVDNVYSGLIPCADCSGIEATLLVNPDGSYVEQLLYLETKNGNQIFHETGNWSANGNMLTLTNAQAERSYFAKAADNNSVTLLDINGERIESAMNYTLGKVTPSKKIGEYRYMADAAIFTECETGRKYATSGIELERAYGETGVDGGTPVYVEVDGYYTIRPSMEDGQFDSALVPTGKIKFDPSASCK